MNLYEENTKIRTVNRDGEYIGWISKLEAHRKSVLHKAFSVFIHDGSSNMLIQKRAECKYHSGGLWSNACCSHVSSNIALKNEAELRLKKEMGFSVPLDEVFEFIYCEKVSDELVENEHDTVFVGIYKGEVQFDPDEVSDYRWIGFEELLADVDSAPEKYTVWFRRIVDKVINNIIKACGETDEV